MSNCQAPTGADQAINTTFLGYDVDASTGVMGNRDTSSDAAKGFGIQLMDSSTSGNPVTLAGATNVPGLTLKVGDTEASYDFGARYFVIDSAAATAGKITAVRIHPELPLINLLAGSKCQPVFLCTINSDFSWTWKR